MCDSPEAQMEYRIDCIVRELDELVAFAANPETVDLVIAEKIGIWQILNRAQFVATRVSDNG